MLERRIDSLMRAHMLRMSLKARMSRRKASELTAAPEAAEAALAEAAEAELAEGDPAA